MIVLPGNIDQVLLGGIYFSLPENRQKRRKRQVAIESWNLCTMYKNTIWCAEFFRMKSTGNFEAKFGTVQKKCRKFWR